MDKRNIFFKSYVNRLRHRNQEPKPGSSKTKDPGLNVVRKLTFQTPKKQKKSPVRSSSNISNKSNQKHVQCTSVIGDDNSEEIFNLSDEGIESADQEKDSTMQIELEIFREIKRRAEIEEACEQIRREHSSSCKQDMEDINLETTNRSPNSDFDNCQEILTDITLKNEKNIPINTDYKLPLYTLNEDYTDNKSRHVINVSEIARDEDKIQDINCSQNILEKSDDDTLNLKCLEDFQEMEFDLQGDIYFENKSPTTKKSMAVKIGKKRHSVNENDQILYDTKTPKKNKIQENPKDNQISPENKNITSNKEIKKSAISSKQKVDEESTKKVDDIVNSAVLEGKACNSPPVRSDLNKNNEFANCDSSNLDEHVKRKSIRQKNRQKYVDFLSDDEDFVWSSSSWEETTEPESASSGVINKKKKKGREDKNSESNCGTSVGVSKRKKQKNVRKEKKMKREAGEEYSTAKGKIIAAKTMKFNPCSLNNCTNKCYEITDERRKSLFTHFWSLGTMRRRDWLVSHSKKLTVKRHRSLNISKRKNTFNYFINEGEGQRQVCQKFLTGTLDIKQKTLYNTVVNSRQGSAREDMRGKHVPSNKTTDSVIESVRTFIQELPALPSHYCRKNSKKTYLPREFRNLSNLYRIYKVTQEENGLQYVGEKVFKKIFTTEYNIGFHLPRKDKCLKCTQFENGTNIDEQQKQKHLKDKEDTAKRFKAHQEIYNKDNSILCTTFDLQKVLNTPHGENMMLYYSRKLSVYNLTFYESCTRNGFCYTWSESDGKRGANEVSSILQKYINGVDQRQTIKHLLLYCDSCPGQNKNKTILACINETLQNCNNLLSIQINYLLPGHTYMPVDSVHSVIEKSLNGVIIWAPSQWSTVFSLARKSPKPYEVEVLSYTDFKKWDAISDKYFKGNLVGKISKIRTATFKKSAPDSVFVKFCMDLDAETERIEIIKKTDANQLKPCYKTSLQISKKKYTDLNKLCTKLVIPTMYHEEYKKLHYNNNIQDCLADTDEEDEENAD